MNGNAYTGEGLSLENLGLDPAAEDMAEVVDEEPESSLMDEDYAEEEDEDELDEAWSEEEERPTQYDLRQYGVYQSLPIPAGPPDLQSDCTTVEEYIKRVRYEAERLPQTVTSRIDPRDFDAQRTDYIPLQDQDTVTAADCIPSQQWLTEFLADFASLRAQLHKEEEDFDPFLPRPPPPPPPHPLPHFRDKNGWQRYCLGAPQPQPAQHSQQPQQQQQQQPSAAANVNSSAHTQPLHFQQQHAQDQQQMTQHQQQLTQDQNPAQESEHHTGMLPPPETTSSTPDPLSNALSTQPAAGQPVNDQHTSREVAMDQDGPVSGKFSTTEEGSMAEADPQTLPEQIEAMPADSMHQDVDTEDVIADPLHGDAAKAMLGEDRGAGDVAANGMSEEVEAESRALERGTEAAPAEGHLPQMGVLASLDQVTINYLLQWHVNWAVAAASISDVSMRWLYALTAQIEKPIASESSSQLSKLLRHCVGVRKTIKDDNDARLLSIHMLIALAGGYFGQDGTLASCMQPGWV